MRREEHQIGENQIFVEQLIPDRAADTEEETEVLDWPVVFVHGAFGASFVFEKISSAMAEEGFECLSLSLRGHGRSGGDLGDASLEDYARDLEEVVGELGLDRYVLAGHSLGGLVSFMYARSHTDELEALVGLDPALPGNIWDIDNGDKLEGSPEVLKIGDLEGNMSVADLQDRLPDISKEYLLEMTQRSGEEPKRVFEQIIEGVSIPVDSFGDVPLLLMGVELDNVLETSIPAEKVKEMAEEFNGDFVAIKGATHPGIVLGESAGEVGKIISQWLREQKEISESSGFDQ